MGGVFKKSKARIKTIAAAPATPAPVIPEEPPQPIAEKVMPLADDARVRLEKRRALARRLNTKGSASTILSAGSKGTFGA